MMKHSCGHYAPNADPDRLCPACRLAALEMWAAKLPMDLPQVPVKPTIDKGG